jgi:hypothetical protein
MERRGVSRADTLSKRGNDAMSGPQFGVNLNALLTDCCEARAGALM